MRKRIIFTYLLTILMSVCSMASIQVRSRFLSAENGLKASYIRSIVQDSRGYIWMGATNGLIRYDGYSADLIRPDETNNRRLMQDDRVLTVDIWLNRFVWVRLRGQKYCCYDTQTDCFVDYTGNNSMNESFRYYYILDNGELWLSDKNNGCKVIRFDGKEFSNQRFSDSNHLPDAVKLTLPPQHAHLLTAGRELIKDNRDNIVVVSKQGELWHIDHKSNEVTHLSGLYSEDLLRQNGTPRYSVVTDKNGIIWISTFGNGLFAYEPQTHETTHFLKSGTNIAPIQTNYLLRLYEDKAGNIWVCQENMGVAIISKQDVNTKSVYFTSSERMDHTNSIHLLTRIGDQIYIGNRNNTLKIADGSLNFLKTIESFKDDVVAVCADKQGTIWMGTRESGIYAGNLKLCNKEGDDSSLSKGKISDVICDKSGRVWISVFDSGVDLAQPDGKGSYTFRHFFTGKNAINHPRKMLVDHGGFLWLCSDKGIYTFDPEKLIANPKAYIHFDIGKEREAKTNEVHSIFEDSENYVLAGTAGNGLAEFDNRKPGKPVYTCDYTIDDGVTDNNIQQIIEDESLHLWFGTGRGLARFDRQKNSTMFFMPANTLQGNMFVENAVCKLADGKIAFGSRHGIVVIDTKNIRPQKPLFKLRITDIDINGISIQQILHGNFTTMLNGGEGIKLDHNDNSLTFHFSDFEYNESPSSKFTYRLSGYDHEWSQLSAYNFAVYKNLPSGDYIFEVKTQNANGEWNEAIIHMPVTIRPPLWATWWAYLIYAVILASIIIYVYQQVKRENALRNRIKVEQQLTEFKMQFFTNISHEFRTPLTIIRNAMERIEETDNMPGEMKQPVNSMQKSVNRLLRMINQLLEFSKMHEGKLKLAVEKTDIVGFMRDIYSSFYAIAENKRINYQFTTFAQSYEMYIDREYLDKIAYNIISNAFKYTPSRNDITVRIGKDDNSNMVTITVEDTGIGISKEKQKELFTRFNQSTFAKDSIGIGLHLTQELVRVHHGTINYQENPKGGSIFTVALPSDSSVYSENDYLVADNVLLKEENENTGQPLSEYREHLAEPMNDLYVLIVEDDNDVRDFLQNELHRYFNTYSACDGKEAVDKIKEQKPDLIISDVMMPIMNGYELTQYVRKTPELADIPIILLTALSEGTKQVKGLDSGADVFLTKPFSRSVLLAQCTQLLQQRKRLRISYAKEVVGKVEVPALIVEEQEKRLRAQFDTWLSSHLKDSNLNIDEFAEKMGYGRTTFYKKFKSMTGFTPNDYIKNMRMQKAIELLKDETLTVAQVSYEVGIDDPYYFSKSFKSFFGISPTQYRKGESPKQ